MAISLCQSSQSLKIEPLAGALGAKVSGVDLAQPLDDQLQTSLYKAFLQYHVLFFRDQQLDPHQQLAATRLFGEPVEYPFLEGLADTPEVIEIIKSEDDPVNFGGTWHSDTAYMPQPAKGTLLHAIDVPAAGGDTLFANAAAACASLSPGLRECINRLAAVNNSDLGYGGSRQQAMKELDAMKHTYNTASNAYENVHPVVRTHPETGLQAIYLSRAHTARFEGMSTEESRPLLHYLADHITRPEFTCRFRWRPGSVAVWDNRVTQHYALNDYAGHRRHMRRVTMKGDRPA